MGKKTIRKIVHRHTFFPKLASVHFRCLFLQLLSDYASESTAGSSWKVRTLATNYLYGVSVWAYVPNYAMFCENTEFASSHLSMFLDSIWRAPNGKNGKGWTFERQLESWRAFPKRRRFWLLWCFTLQWTLAQVWPTLVHGLLDREHMFEAVIKVSPTVGEDGCWA